MILRTDSFERALRRGASLVAMLVKIVLTAPPARPTAPIAMSAMSATSNAYSSRSWPSSLRANDLTR